MNLAARLKPLNTPLTLVAAVLVVAALTQLLDISLLTRIVTVMFVSLMVVLGLQLYMGNSGILNFAHVGFMGIGAYTAVLLSMTSEAKVLTNADLYPFLVQLHLPFLPSLLIGGLVAALVAAVISYPLMRLSDAAAVITTF
ncbi:MAG TPA: branched-chain amino acid ABC transporter permease, partial [bacterium]